MLLQKGSIRQIGAPASVRHLDVEYPRCRVGHERAVKVRDEWAAAATARLRQNRTDDSGLFGRYWPPVGLVVHRMVESFTEFEARLCSGDPTCTPITLRHAREKSRRSPELGPLRGGHYDTPLARHPTALASLVVTASPPTPGT